MSGESNSNSTTTTTTTTTTSHTSTTTTTNGRSLVNRVWSFLERREVLATVTVVPLTYWYWNLLVESLQGSTWKAVLIVLCAWIGIAVDVNEHMIGQPGGGGEHDHHHD